MRSGLVWSGPDQTGPDQTRPQNPNDDDDNDDDDNDDNDDNDDDDDYDVMVLILPRARYPQLPLGHQLGPTSWADSCGLIWKEMICNYFGSCNNHL